MAFPISPTNGQQATVNGVLYTYSSSLTAWTVTSSGGSISTANSIVSTGNISGTNLISSANAIIGNDLYVGTGANSTGFTNPVIVGKDTGLTYVQIAAVNSSGNGSADFAAYSNNGTETGGWVDIGYTGNTFNDPGYTVTAPNDGYLITQGNASFGGNLVIATGNIGTTKDIVFATGGFLTGNIKARLVNSTGEFSVTGNVTAGNINGFSRPSAGTTALAPILLTSGTNLTTATAGAMEYDGTTLYGTENSTTGRGELGVHQQYRYTSAGSALGAAIADYFPANSSINLEAASIYDIECVAYFLKTTAATITWTWLASSAPSVLRSFYQATAIAGFTTSAVTTAPVTAQVVAQSLAAVPHAVTGSLSTGAYHIFQFKVFVITNLATNLRLRVTNTSGTVTPQAGSYYMVRKLSANAGNFAA